MLAPIYNLLFAKHGYYNGLGRSQPSLELTEDQIIISYKTYKTDNPADMQEIIDQKICPGTELQN